MNAAVVVTGAGGFVGSAVLRRMVRRLRHGPLPIGGTASATRVVGVVRPGGSNDRLRDLEAGPMWEARLADLADASAVGALFDEVRPLAVVHTALDRSVFTETSSAERDRAVRLPLENVVAALAEAGGVRIVHTGSVWVLPAGGSLGEATVPAPHSPYALAKDLEDHLLPDIAARRGVEWVNLRLFNLYGRYERAERLIPYLVAQLTAGRPADLSHGEHVRDFTDVDLVSDAFVGALGASRETANRLYHIGTGRGTRVRDIARIVADLIGRPDLLRFGARETPDADVPIQVADPARARAALGWDPPDDLPERVRAVTQWWRTRLAARGSSAVGGWGRVPA